METQDTNNLPVTKGDIKMVLEAIQRQNDFGIEMPEDPGLLSLWKRLDQIEKVTKKVAGIGLPDVPISAKEAAAITGLAVNTVKKYGSYRALPIVKIGRKVQYSLKGCIQLVKAGSRKAAIDCTSDITGYHRKKKKRKGKASTTACLTVTP